MGYCDLIVGMLIRMQTYAGICDQSNMEKNRDAHNRL